MDSLGLDGKDLLTDVIANSLLYSYLEVANKEAGSNNFAKAAGKPLISHCCKNFSSFLEACKLLGLDLDKDTEDISIRGLYLQIVANLCFRYALEKQSYTTVDPKTKKPKSIYFLKLNLKASSWPKLTKLGLNFDPWRVTLIKGDLFY